MGPGWHQYSLGFYADNRICKKHFVRGGRPHCTKQSARQNAIRGIKSRVSTRPLVSLQSWQRIAR